jgi:hypothetical protein
MYPIHGRFRASGAWQSDVGEDPVRETSDVGRRIDPNAGEVKSTKRSQTRPAAEFQTLKGQSVRITFAASVKKKQSHPRHTFVFVERACPSSLT